jgi:hypothetical protein
MRRSFAISRERREGFLFAHEWVALSTGMARATVHQHRLGMVRMP